MSEEKERLTSEHKDVEVLGAYREISKDIVGGNTHKLKEYLKNRDLETVLNSLNVKKGNPLHDACQCKFLGAATEMVAHLLAWLSSKVPVEAEGKLLPKLLSFINRQDEDWNTALHYAAKKNNWQASKALLLFGATPHTANKKGEKVLMLLYKHVLLSVLTLLKKQGDIHFSWNEKWESLEDIKIVCNFSEIIGEGHNPIIEEGANQQGEVRSEVVMDDMEPTHVETRIEMVNLEPTAVSHFNTRPLESRPPNLELTNNSGDTPPKIQTTETRKTKHPKIQHEQNEMLNLSQIVFHDESIQKEILCERSVQFFIDLKWNNLKKPIYLSIVLNSMWSILCIISIMYASQLKYGNIPNNFNLNFTLCENETGKAIVKSDEFTDTPNNRNSSDVILRSILFVSSIFIIIKEIVSFSFLSPGHRTPYLCRIEKFAVWVLTTFMICFFSNLFPLPLLPGQIISVVALIAAFVIILSQLQKHPWFGTYLELFTKVLRRFGVLFICISPILILCALLFNLIMPEAKQMQLRPPFVFVKIVAMMSGEITFDDITKEGAGGSLGTVLSKMFLLLTFIAIVTLLLQNIFIGLVVDEFKNLEKLDAKTNRLRNTILQLYRMEELILTVGKILSYFIGDCGKWLENSPQIRDKGTSSVTRKIKDFSPECQEILRPLMETALENQLKELEEKLKNAYITISISPEVGTSAKF